MTGQDLLEQARAIAERMLKQARGDKKEAYSLFLEELPMTMRQELEDLWFQRGVYTLFAEANGRGRTGSGHRAGNHVTHVEEPEPQVPALVSANIPRISVEALMRANQRLQDSILDTVQINGRALGDYRVHEVEEWCKTRVHATAVIRAVIKDLPGQQVLRHAISAADAEARRLKAAQPALDGYTIDAHKPDGYRVL